MPTITRAWRPGCSVTENLMTGAAEALRGGPITFYLPWSTWRCAVLEAGRYAIDGGRAGVGVDMRGFIYVAHDGGEVFGVDPRGSRLTFTDPEIP